MNIIQAQKKRNQDYHKGFDDGVRDGIKITSRLLIFQMVLYLGDKRGWNRRSIFEAIRWIHKHAEMILEDYTSYEETIEDARKDYGIVFEDNGFVLLSDEEMKGKAG